MQYVPNSLAKWSSQGASTLQAHFEDGISYQPHWSIFSFSDLHTVKVQEAMGSNLRLADRTALYKLPVQRLGVHIRGASHETQTTSLCY